jgi:hypothetical protein
MGSSTHALGRYSGNALLGSPALGNLGNQVLAREYQLALPTEEQLIRRLEAKRRQLDQ